MDNWATVVVSLVGSGLVGPAFAVLWKHLSAKSIARQNVQQTTDLSVGVTSHMATVAFDKHIEFCEKYVKEMYKALDALIQDGRTDERWIQEGSPGSDRSGPYG
jgi:outer membrane PBP1 activator LpoA protein